MRKSVCPRAVSWGFQLRGGLLEVMGTHFIYYFHYELLELRHGVILLPEQINWADAFVVWDLFEGLISYLLKHFVR